MASQARVRVVGAWDQPRADAADVAADVAAALRVERRVVTVERDTGVGVSRPGVCACEAERRVPTMMGCCQESVLMTLCFNS